MAAIETGACERTSAALTERLAKLIPGLDVQQLVNASARICANLAALVCDANGPTSLATDLDATLHALVLALTDTDMLVLMLEPSTRADGTSAAYDLLAAAPPSLQEATLDALSRLAAGNTGRSEHLSGGFAQALAQSRHPNASAVRSQSPARRMREAEPHDETALLEAAHDGDDARVASILSTASGLPASAIRRAADLRSAKALVSLAWKSGFTMQAAIAAQMLLGQLAPSHLLEPGPTGGYPLSREEMEWQLELVAERCRI